MASNSFARSSFCSSQGLALMMILAALLCTAAPARSYAFEFPILLYHRFGPRVSDSMTVKTDVFESQLQELERRGYHVIPLRQLVDHLAAKGLPPPPRSVAITVDDAHRSVYTELLPIVLRHRIPVTVFVYPSAISNASYAMTWEQLSELKATGLFDIQSHTYWHPNFKREKRKLTPEAYRRFVDTQLMKSRQALETRLGGNVNLLAWPFGLYDKELEDHARKAGYIAAFTMDRRPARSGDNPMEIPRYLITGSVNARAFNAILDASKPGPDIKRR